MARATEPATSGPGLQPPVVKPPKRKRRLPEGLSSFSVRDYRIYFVVQLISLSGLWIQALAQSWLVLQMTNSPFLLGLVNVVQFAPALVLGLPGGVVADRVVKRNLILVTQTTSGILAAILAFLVASGRVELWHVYLIALLFGLVDSFDLPARQAFIADMVGRDNLQNAVALNSALFNTTRIIGPALAGVLLAAGGTALCFALNAISFVPVVIGLALMESRGHPAPGARRASPRAQLREGLRFTLATPTILLPIVLAGFVATFGMNFSVWVPLLAEREFRAGAAGFGWMMSALGVGSLTGALSLAFFRRANKRTMVIAAACFGVAEVLLALVASSSLPVAVSLPIMSAIGFFMTNTMTTANTVVQTNSPDVLRGRVMNIYTTVFAGTAPVGSAIAGTLSAVAGAAFAVGAGGVLVILAALAIAARGDALVASRAVPREGAP